MSRRGNRRIKFIILLILIIGIFSILYMEGPAIQGDLKAYLQGEEGTRVDPPAPAQASVNPDRFIAHAGGEVYGLTYTNSLDALNRSYLKGFRYMELDFKYSADGELVLIHDWEKSVEDLFNIEARVLTQEEFKNLPTTLDLELMDLEDLIYWLDEHREVQIVTDTTEDNLAVLKDIGEAYPDHRDRFIAQIYRLEEYGPVRDLGYEDIILTLYLCPNTDDEIVEFVGEKDLFGVAIGHSKSYDYLVKRLVELDKTRLYSHTVNSIRPYRVLKDKGFYGFYTDYLEINSFIE